MLWFYGVVVVVWIGNGCGGCHAGYSPYDSCLNWWLVSGIWLTNGEPDRICSALLSPSAVDWCLSEVYGP